MCPILMPDPFYKRKSPYAVLLQDDTMEVIGDQDKVDQGSNECLMQTVINSLNQIEGCLLFL